jgi:hypothetical protein
MSPQSSGLKSKLSKNPDEAVPKPCLLPVSCSLLPCLHPVYTQSQPVQFKVEVDEARDLLWSSLLLDTSMSCLQNSINSSSAYTQNHDSTGSPLYRFELENLQLSFYI